MNSSTRRPQAGVLGGAAILGVLALTLSACGSGRTDSDDGGGGSADKIVIGTTDKLVALDPAASYDQGSFSLQQNVFSFLMATEPGSGNLTPDAAESCAFSDPSIFACKVKDGLTFANGNPLDAAAAKFSFDRIIAINDPEGPASLLENLESTTVDDATNTVEFHLKRPNDQTFEEIIAANVGPILDPETVSGTAKVSDEELVAANTFSGPYAVSSFRFNERVELTPNPNYSGAYGTPKNDGIVVTYLQDSTNLKLGIENGDIDIAARLLTPDDVTSLRSNSEIKIVDGPSGAIQYLVFNLNTMPGDTPEQKLNVRKSIAYALDRPTVVETAYKDTASPLYSLVATAMDGSVDTFKDTYGEAPDLEKAKEELAAAGVSTPLTIDLQYSPDHYGPKSPDLFAAIKTQLESTGLYKINLKSADWVTYSEERTTDLYPVYQMGWFPDFPDADNYLNPFFSPNNFLKNHFEAEEITTLLGQESSEADPAKRAELLAQIQELMTTKYLSTIPILETGQFIATKSNIGGAQLDKSFKFIFAGLTKS